MEEFKSVFKLCSALMPRNKKKVLFSLVMWYFIFLILRYMYTGKRRKFNNKETVNYNI